MAWELISGQMRTTAVVFSLILIYLNSASALKCYQCNSTLDHNCQERFNHGMALNAEKYYDCDLENAKFCIKASGLWGGVVGTFRFCSSRDLGDQCQEIWFPDHDRMYRACVMTCYGDGCNSATHLSYPITSLVLSVLAALYFSGRK